MGFRILGLGFRVWGLGFRVWGEENFPWKLPSHRYRMQASASKASKLGIWVQCLGFRVSRVKSRVSEFGDLGDPLGDRLRL